MKTKPLIAQKYIHCGEVNLTRLVTDAVESLAVIRRNGVGMQRGRSRRVVFRSFKAVLVRSGIWTESQAREIWRDQVLAIESLENQAFIDGIIREDLLSQ